jgi:hypothetical protein
MREKIEECFYRGDAHPKATNVGELIEQLKRLPPELKVDSNFSHGVQLVVLNVSSYGPEEPEWLKNRRLKKREIEHEKMVERVTGRCQKR